MSAIPIRVHLSLAAVVCGLWLLCLGYQRRQYLDGKADSSLSRLGQRIDGAVRK